MVPRGTNGVMSGFAIDRRALRADSAEMTPPQGRVPTRVIFGVATALGFFSAFAAFYFVSTFTSKPAAFGLLLTLNLGYWYSWAALTPAILALTRSFPFDRSRWKISIPVHIAGVLVAVSLHVVLAVATRMVTYYAIGESLDFLSKYLEIRQTRFRDRLTVVFDVQADTRDALVPNLLLQPLVENAIKHGIGPRPTPGQIAVRARINGAMLELDVQDNGVGLSAARLTDFNRGVGLSNTRSRLDHLYGSLHRFEFRQPAEGGLLVCIAIPLAELAVEVDGEAEAVEAIA